MRSITISYEYSGDESPWQNAISDFIGALDRDPKAAGFSYQVVTADNGTTRIHWGRWDTAETLAHMQSQPYFKRFAESVGRFSGGTHKPIPADIGTKTANW